MPQFWQKSFIRSSSRQANGNSFFVEGSQQHPDLPLPPGPRPSNIQRSTSVSERGGHYLENRRSVALFPSPNPNNYQDIPPAATPPAPSDSYYPPPRSPGPAPGSGITRSQTVVYRDQHRNRDVEPIYEVSGAPSPLWSPEHSQLPTPNEQPDQEPDFEPPVPMNVTGKTSSDSGAASGLDRWSARRLQRLNTEQGFREQRQTGSGSSGGNSSILSPIPGGSGEQYAGNAPQDFAQPQSQPQQLSYPSTRTTSNAGLRPSNNNNNHHNQISPNYAHDPAHHSQAQTQQQPAYPPPPDALTQYQNRQQQQQAQQHAQQARNYQVAPPDAHDSSLSMSNNGLAKAATTNRQSVHNALMSREGSNVSSQGVSAFNASVVPAPLSQAALKSDPSQQLSDPRRATPQPGANGEEMSEDDVNQLIKDHKELREKYTKVKKYYFEKEDQVKQLQNSLASQRLSQSRTSLDDSEYTTRFNRLDGLIAQLAFSIRKSWRSLPSWLANSVNKDAVITGKQEMTAAGRAFISCWLVEEVFDKYFHPDLEPALSAQLKAIQRNIRRFAPQAQTSEEEDYLIAKVVNWRLATLEGLQDALRSPQCPTFRTQMTDMLKENLCAALAVHLQDPPPSDLEGGVHMIVELVVSIAIHLPLESRDVVIEYYMPSHLVLQDQMKLESGIPALTISIAEDAAERASMKSANSEVDNDSSHDQPGKKRGMLSALTGSGGKSRSSGGGSSSANSQQQKQSASGSSSSLQRPDSASGKDEPPKVRMAAGIGVAIRGRSVLVKAPVFST